MPDVQVGGVAVVVEQDATADAQAGGMVAVVDQNAVADVRIGGIYVLVDVVNVEHIWPPMAPMAAPEKNIATGTSAGRQADLC